MVLRDQILTTEGCPPDPEDPGIMEAKFQGSLEGDLVTCQTGKAETIRSPERGRPCYRWTGSRRTWLPGKWLELPCRRDNESWALRGPDPDGGKYPPARHAGSREPSGPPCMLEPLQS